VISRTESSTILRNLLGGPLINSWNRQQIALRREKEVLRGIDSTNDKRPDGRIAKSASSAPAARLGERKTRRAQRLGRSRAGHCRATNASRQPVKLARATCSIVSSTPQPKATCPNLLEGGDRFCVAPAD